MSALASALVLACAAALSAAAAPAEKECVDSDTAFQGQADLNYSCMIELPLSSTFFHWTWSGVLGEVGHFAVSTTSRGWLAVAFPDTPGKMTPAKGIMYDGDPADLKTMVLTDRHSPSSGPTLDATVKDTLQLTNLGYAQADGVYMLSFDMPLHSLKLGINVARDRRRTAVAHHTTNKASVYLDFTTGNWTLPEAIPDYCNGTETSEVVSVTDVMFAGGDCVGSHLGRTDEPGSERYDFVARPDSMFFHWSWDRNVEGRIHVAASSNSSGWLGVTFPETAGSMLQASGVLTAGGGLGGIRTHSKTTEGVVYDSQVEEELQITNMTESVVGDEKIIRFTMDGRKNTADWTPINMARHLTSNKLQNHYNQHVHIVVDFKNGAWKSLPHGLDCSSGRTDAPPPMESDGCALSTLLKPDSDSYYMCAHSLPLNNAIFHWDWDGVSDEIQVAVSSQTTGWLAFTFPENPTGSRMMYPAAGLCGDDSGVWPLRVVSKRVSGITKDETVEADFNITAKAHVRTDDSTVLYATMASSLFEGDTTISVARHISDTSISDHFNQRCTFVINVLMGSISAEPIIDIEYYRSVHSVLMMVAWLYCVPAGIIFKMYGRQLGLGTNIAIGNMGTGFVLHVIHMVAAVVMTLVGVLIARTYFTVSDTEDAYHHRNVGIAVAVLAGVMAGTGFLGPIFMPKKSSLGRSVLAVLHPGIGRVLGILAIYQMFTGVERLRYVGSPLADRYEFAISIFVCFFGTVILIIGLLSRRFNFVKKGEYPYVNAVNRIALDSVREHCTIEDPWIIINRKVYAVKSLVDIHPGGSLPLFEYAGKDATSEFIEHSSQARAMLPQYYIGDLEDERMTSTIDLAAEIAGQLVMLDLGGAAGMLAESTNVPDSLRKAFDALIGNLAVYIPYLPLSCLPDDGDDSEENVSSRRSVGRGDSDSPLNKTLNRVRSSNGSNGQFTAVSASVDVAYRSNSNSNSNSSHHPSVVSCDKRSQPSAVSEKREAKQPLHLTLGLRRQKVSLVVANMHHTLALAKEDTVGWVDVQAAYLSRFIASVTKSRGVPDMFVGDHFYASFNASKMCVSYCEAAVAACRATLVATDVSCSCNMVVASGLISAGNIGCNEMKRWSIIGSLPLVANALERFSRAAGLDIVCNAHCYSNAGMQFPMRQVLQAIELDNFSDPVYVWELVPDTVCKLANPEEWMYELQEAAGKKWERYNEATKLYLTGGDLRAAAEALGKAMEITPEDPHMASLQALIATETPPVPPATFGLSRVSLTSIHPLKAHCR
ncbi:Cytochrome b5 [Diplonema papillatum]|nr:Cytochrome b5 [Diplonema papillatum]|eukprot:gene6276-9621_t